MKKLIYFIIAIICILLIGNFYVCISEKSKIIDSSSITEKYDYILILGCSVLKNGEPSLMLRDRLNKGIELYNQELAEKIIITGDHSDSYSEVSVMHNYLIDSGIEEDNIIIDNEGYSTSESLINYQKEHKKEKVIIVTQKYHLYRALYIADRLNINAIGVYADDVNYFGQTYRDIREILARNKDLYKMLFIS